MICRKSKYTWARIMSAICVMALCFAFFTGCNDTVSVAELDELEEEFWSLNADYKALNDEYEAALQENEAATQEIASLKGDNEEALQEIGTLKSDNESAAKEIAALKSDSEASAKEIEDLKAKNEAAIKEIESLKEQLSDLIDYGTPDVPGEKIRIYIDQGHNPTSYHNSGASGNGLFEENLTFTIGRLLAGLLMLDGRFDVCLSRPASSTVLGTDNTSSLEARVQGAKDFEADYFISLHINSYDDAGVRGIEVLVAEESGTSYDFGEHILSGLIEATDMNDRGMKHRPELYVLKNATTPAVIVEMGFISNKDDSEMLSQTPLLFAQGIYDGILDYFDLQPNNAI